VYNPHSFLLLLYQVSFWLFTIFLLALKVLLWRVAGGHFGVVVVGGARKRKEAGIHTHTHTHTERYVESVCVCMKVRVPRWLVDQFYLFRAARQTQIHFSPEHVHCRFSLVRFFFYSDPKRSEWYSRRAQGEKKKKGNNKFLKTCFFPIFFFFSKRERNPSIPLSKKSEREGQKITYKLFFVGFGFPFRKRGAHTHTHKLSESNWLPATNSPVPNKSARVVVS
jgi:hypothetical protein